jgi:hypothetical protein
MEIVMTATLTATTTPSTSATPLPKSGTGRFESYTAIHKALRLLMAETLATVGGADAAKETEVAASLGLVRELTQFCRVHLHTENQFIHSAMEARRPGSSDLAAQEHVDHATDIERVEADALAVEKSSGEARASLLLTLYSRLAVFIAANLEHMNEEETHNQAVLWETHSDDELRAIQGAIVASHTPQETAAAVRWMLPALPATERASFVAMLRRAMPDDAFAELTALALARPGAREDIRLMEALGVR